MSRSGFKAHAVDSQGNVLSSASVTVRDQSGVVISPSALFTAYSGASTHASNPFTATGGLISFYVDGSQVVTVSAVSGGTSQTWSNVVLNELINTSNFATSAQGTLADSATQPGDLGTAAATDSTDYATAAQGTKADSALQAADVGTAAAADLTTSTTDKTAGRVLRVGDSGINDTFQQWTATSQDVSSDWAKLATVADSVMGGASGGRRLRILLSTAQGRAAGNDGNSQIADIQLQSTNSAGSDRLVGFAVLTQNNPLSDAITSFRVVQDGTDRQIWVKCSFGFASYQCLAFGDLKITAHTDETQTTDPTGDNYFDKDILKNWTTSNLTKGTNPTDVPTNADLGTAAAADLTTSTTDTTAGRAMKVGYRGLGQTAGDANADNYNFGGFFRDSSGGFNAAYGGNWHCISNTRVENAQSAQFAIRDSGSTTETRVTARHRDSNGTWSTPVELWTTGNYQPETSLGLGVGRKMKNKSGGAIADQAQVAGSSLKAVYTDSSGVEQENAAVVGGTWINVSGMSIGNNEAAEFTKI